MTHFRETQDYHFGQFDSWYGLHTSNFCPGLNTEYDYCSGIELVHPWQVVAQACAGRGYPTLLVLRKCRRCWNHRLRARKAEEKEQTRVSDVWGHNHPRSNHMYDGGHISYGSLYLSTNSNVHWCLRVKDLLSAISMPRWSIKTSFPERSLYDTSVLRNGNYWLYVAVVPHCSYLFTPHYSFVPLPSTMYTDCKTLTAVLLSIQ